MVATYERVHPCQLSLAWNTYNNLNLNAVQNHQSQVTYETNTTAILFQNQNQKLKKSNKIATVTMIQLPKIQKTPFCKTLAKSLKRVLKEIDNLSVSLEKLSVSQRTTKIPFFEKNTKVQFQFKAMNEE